MHIFKKVLLVCVICFGTCGVKSVNAQPPPPPINPAAVPIDGGLGMLLLAGVGLGAGKAWRHKRA